MIATREAGFGGKAVTLVPLEWIEEVGMLEITLDMLSAFTDRDGLAGGEDEGGNDCLVYRARIMVLSKFDIVSVTELA